MTGILGVYRRWPTREACIRHLEAVRWGETPTCPYCASEAISRHRELTRDDRWQCQGCGRSFAVTVGTIFHRTHIDLQRWFLLISLMMAAKKGLSSLQAARDLEMRQPTVWSMMHRIRRSMADSGPLLAGIVEMDEAYVGGKPRKANRRKDDPPGGQGVTGKVAVVGAVERGGRVKARPASDAEMTGEGMERIVREMVAQRDTILTTDQHPGYGGVNKFMAHRTINHSVSYSERDLFSGQFGAIHTNTIESFWAIVKRAVYGQFHHVSRKYLPFYMNELTWRYSERRNPDRFSGVLHLAVKPQTA
jgi:transposase-like protein